MRTGLPRLRLVSILALLFSACAPLSPSPGAPLPELPPTEPKSTRVYTIRQRLILDNYGTGSPDKQNLWVALIRDVPPYQTVSSRTISPKRYQLVHDEYGNQYAEFDFSNHPSGEQIKVEIEYLLEVHEILIRSGDCQGALPGEYTQPELHIESANPQILALSRELSRGKRTPCEQARAFYDYAGDTLIYTYNRDDWGAQAALGYMGADCTEFTSLVMALSRAVGIPARYFEGLLYLGDLDEGIARTEHAWLEVYLPGAGWASVDPTLGRALLNRDTYFAHHTPDHIIVTVGRNPSTLRGSSYWSHLYWPGDSTTIRIKDAGWQITPKPD